MTESRESTFPPLTARLKALREAHARIRDEDESDCVHEYAICDCLDAFPALLDVAEAAEKTRHNRLAAGILRDALERLARGE